MVVITLIFAFLQIFPKNMCLLFLHHYFIQKPKIFHQKSKNEVIEEYPTKESLIYWAFWKETSALQ